MLSLPATSSAQETFQGQPGSIIPTPAELGSAWSQDTPSSAAARETEYRFDRDGRVMLVTVQIVPGRNVDDIRAQYLFGRRIPADFAWTMKPHPGIGERAQSAAGKMVTYLHFVRGNVYVLLKGILLSNGVPEPRELEALDVLARAIDGKLLAATGGKALLAFQETLTQAEVDAAVADVRALVEEVSGQKFDRDPIVRVVGTDELVGACIEDIRLQRANEKKAGRELEFAMQTDRSGRLTGMSSVGRFSYSRRAILLPAETFHAGLARGKIDKALAKQALQVVVAHELVHGLQDQLRPLGETLPKFKDAGAKAAFAAVIEGHAVFVQKRVGERLAIPAAVQNLAMPRQSAEPAPGTSPREKQFVDAIETAATLLYRDGPELMERLYREGGVKRQWEVFANPPQTPAEISKMAGGQPSKE
jgi:hypothetical protein